MNWIIQKSKKITCHTLLNEILTPILNEVKDYNWIFSDIDYNDSQSKNLPINMDDEYFVLTPKQFEIILNADVQIWWGVVLGVPNHLKIAVNESNIPLAEGNALIWKDGNIQYPDAEIEIICFDSGYTIVKFKNEVLSKHFKVYFPEAIQLEKFSQSFI
ncbi:hypothetical protein BDD43_5545 [Mucilaginibacter gracilis]|uniref:DUF2691 family protein n=1 Tax=Mucilaginibacter gracilis TaxID=423350 RepID=A0A495J9C6_9SPHI|nr:hypothetical protein [Mucilaginibacter gracilis]RKR85281.1 hypothetical protein BDD43_5545 [Mucilaginibacter gracilis]